MSLFPYLLCAAGLLLVLMMQGRADNEPSAQPPPEEKVVLVLHGGAGTIRRADMTAEREARYRAALSEALKAGHAVVSRGGSAVDAVESAVRVLEDDPLFNAGKGAVFTHDGRNELDASIMDGRTRAAGAVAAVTVVKNPISLARAVMEKSPHVMMAGPGAEEFARGAGIEIVDPSYFRTDERRRQLEREREREKEKGKPISALSESAKFGTVGVVALDKNGNLAAGTSTGGMTNKRHGRIGDSPIIGAGTWADNATCGVSATGHGEYFIRWAVAHDIAALMEYRGLSVAQAADEVVNKKLKAAGGVGGVVALDAKGNAALPFNSEGMYRGFVTESGKVTVAIFRG